MTENEFTTIEWPKEFFIRFDDGIKLLCVSSQGVTWDAGRDESDENEGRANINCCLQKKSSSQQSYRSIQVWVDEIASVQSVDGSTLWRKPL